MANAELKPFIYESPAYRLFDREQLAEVRECAEEEREARAAFEATLSDEQKRLAFKLHNAEDELRGREHYFQMRAMIRKLAEHFPGIGPALELVAGHVAWGSNIEMSCCELHDHGVGL